LLREHYLLTALPAVGVLDGATTTTGQYQTAIAQVRQVIAEMLGGSSKAAVTLSANAFTPAAGQGTFVVSPSVASSPDTLKNIAATNVGDGRVIMLTPASATGPITVHHANGGAGQILNMDAADFVLADPSQFCLYIYDSTAGTFTEIFRSYGNQKTSFRSFLGLGIWNAALAATAGGVLYTDGTTIQNTGGGTNGNVLALSGGVPTWSTNAPAWGYNSHTASFSAAVGNVYKVDTSGGAVTCTLPTAVGCAGQSIRVKLGTAGNALTFAFTSGQNCDGSTSLSTNVVNDFFEFTSDGANWMRTG